VGVASVELLVVETCSAALAAERRRAIDETGLKIVVDAALRLSDKNVVMFPQGELVPGAVEIALSNGLSVYDALYLALAKTLKAPLLSLDFEQLQTARRIGIRVLRE